MTMNQAFHNLCVETPELVTCSTGVYTIHYVSEGKVEKYYIPLIQKGSPYNIRKMLTVQFEDYCTEKRLMKNCIVKITFMSIKLNGEQTGFCYQDLTDKLQTDDFITNFISLQDCCQNTIALIAEDEYFCNCEDDLMEKWYTSRGFTKDDYSYAVRCGYEERWFCREYRENVLNK